MTVQTAIKRFGKTYAMVVGGVALLIVAAVTLVAFFGLPIIVYGLATGASMSEIANTSYLYNLPRWVNLVFILWELGFVALIFTFLGWADETGD